eukprot:CAMPEP_0169222302 /NCGR_PEP_ID=MMETSP1016-20121227/21521_1 /TAXON_ID=342587 /ORGANISM="Karlodinium micrum, Strain CCMP2283" /LENGTH=42 /DNA_ID= /DNA_START= /DNA_END= /DNA_ORIENTATION=
MIEREDTRGSMRPWNVEISATARELYCGAEMARTLQTAQLAA